MPDRKAALASLVAVAVVDCAALSWDMLRDSPPGPLEAGTMAVLIACLLACLFTLNVALDRSASAAAGRRA